MTTLSLAAAVAVHMIYAGDDLIVESWRMGEGPVPLEPGIGPSAVAVSAGSVSLRGPGGTISLGTGEVAAIPAGAAITMTGNAGSLLYRVACLRRGGRTGDAPVYLDCAVTRRPTPLPPVEVMLSPMPTCAGAVLFEDEAAGFKIGIWGSTPYARRVVPHRVHEFMLLRAGAVGLVDHLGRARRTASPEGCFIAKGEPAGWLSEEDVEKIYIVQD